MKGANGDANAQRTLLAALGPALLRVIRAVLGSRHPDVEDALQEAMVAIHGSLPTFRGESTIVHFACRIALKTALKVRRYTAYRAQNTAPAPEDQLEVLATRSTPDSSDAVAARERREILRQLLCELPLVQAEVLGLHTMLGYSIEQTAAATGAPVNTVRSRLRNALATLRNRVSADQSVTSQGGNSGGVNSTGDSSTTGPTGGTTSQGGTSASSAGGKASAGESSTAVGVGGATTTGGNSGTSGATSAVSCPQSPPTNATGCGNTAISCFYDSSPNGGRILANCMSGSWSVQSGTSCSVSCVVLPFSKSCAAGEICVIIAGGTISGNCQKSTCSQGLITEQCVGTSGCSVSSQLDAGTTVTCNSCPQGGCA